MQINAELNALFSLIDDPDEEVYSLISTKIKTFGKEIIPCLEDLCETTDCNETQGRINEIIHQLNFAALANELQEWNLNTSHDLLMGCTLIARFVNPQLPFGPSLMAAEKIKRSIWLELNDLLTSLEKVNVVSNILFYFQNIQSERNNYQHLDRFLLHNLLEQKEGNAISTGILYQYLCENLHIPVRLINIPDQYLLACFQRNYKTELNKTTCRNLILFYIDATTGKIYSQADLDNYFELYNIKQEEKCFVPLTHQQIIQKLLMEVGRCFLVKRHLHRKKELDILASLLTKV